MFIYFIYKIFTSLFFLDIFLFIESLENMLIQNILLHHI